MLSLKLPRCSLGLNPLPNHSSFCIHVDHILCVCVVSRFSRVRLFVTLWTVAHQVPLSTGFSRQEYWSWLPCPPPGIKPSSLLSSALTGLFFFLPLAPPGKPETHTSSNKTSSMKAFEICLFHLLLLAYINHNLLSAKFSNISCTFPGTR